MKAHRTHTNQLSLLLIPSPPTHPLARSTKRTFLGGGIPDFCRFAHFLTFPLFFRFCHFCHFFPFCQTGSGKTFTMGSGHGEVPADGAIIPHVLDALFSLVQQSEETTECQILVSLVEVRPFLPLSAPLSASQVPPGWHACVHAF